MALISWDNKYSVGVKTLDSQHTVLFGILNELHEAMLKGQAQNLTGPMLRRLAVYTNQHFSAEEAMLETAKYPGLTEHRIKHRDLIKQVEDYTARLERGEITVNIHLMNFLRDWLSTHIVKTDKEYGPWLNQKGIN